jgi:hypothetical protein
MSSEERRTQLQSYVELIGGILQEAPGLYGGSEISNLISMAAFIDGAIVRVISTYFAADKPKASYLADNIVDRIPFDRKLKTLTHVLKRNTWDHEFPNLITQLRQLFQLRDELAHSFLDDEVRTQDNDLVFTRYSWADGGYQEVSVSIAAITKAKKIAQETILEDLMMILGRVESAAPPAGPTSAALQHLQSERTSPVERTLPLSGRAIIPRQRCYEDDREHHHCPETPQRD